MAFYDAFERRRETRPSPLPDLREVIYWEKSDSDGETAVCERFMECVCTPLGKGKAVFIIREAVQERKTWCMKTTAVTKKLPYLKALWNVCIQVRQWKKLLLYGRQ